MKTYGVAQAGVAQQNPLQFVHARRRPDLIAAIDCLAGSTGFAGGIGRVERDIPDARATLDDPATLA